MNKIRVLLTFILVIFNIFLIHKLEESEIEVRKIEAKNFGEKQIEVYKNVMSDYIYNAEVFEILLMRDKYTEKEFEKIAKTMIEKSDVIRAIQLAPNGVIKQSYPFEENRAGMIDLFSNKRRNKEVEFSKETGKTTFTGPYDLFQGGKGMIIRNPMYIRNDKNEKVFWGFSIIILDYYKLIEESNFAELKKLNYNYQIIQDKFIEDTEAPKLLMKSGELTDPVVIEYEIIGQKRRLLMEPIKGWQSSFDRSKRVIISLIAIILFIYIAQKLIVKKKLEKLLTEEQILNECISMLYAHKDIDRSISKLLEILAKFYSGQRSYIFEYRNNNAIIQNTHEWCAKGVKSQINEFNNIESNIILPFFNKSTAFRIENIEKDLDHKSLEYKFFKKYNINSVVIALLFDLEGNVNGFIGIDNPKSNIKNSALIEKISIFIAEFLMKEQMIKKLDLLSYSDRLTGVKNYHAYADKLEKLKLNLETTLGIAYFDINGLKKINDTLGHEKGDQLIIQCANFLKTYFGDSIFRIGGDEFVLIEEKIEKSAFNEIMMKFKEDLEHQEFNMSFGYSWYENSINLEEKIKSVDQLMYSEKFNYYSNKTE